MRVRCTICMRCGTIMSMAAEIIDGKRIAAALRDDARMRAQALVRAGVTPSLAVTIVGDNPASHSYIKAKKKACAEAGIQTTDTHFGQTVTQPQLMEHVDRLNGDPNIDGILIQLPLPAHIDEHALLCAVAPHKDVDGFHPHNVGLLTLGTPLFEPCTPKGIVYMLTACGARLSSAEVVIVGRSNIVGKPLALMLMRKADNANATVTVCHSATRDIAAHTRRADVLIAAMGSPRTITADMVKAGAVVIDVGVNRVPDDTTERGYRLCGDVDFDGVSQVAAKITPVPGGVGPMTIAMLLQNTLDAADRRAQPTHRTKPTRRAQSTRRAQADPPCATDPARACRSAPVAGGNGGRQCKEIANKRGRRWRLIHHRPVRH